MMTNLKNGLKNRVFGFTLIEMLLVLVIIAAILVGLLGYTQQKTESMRRDRTAMQMQQIENAAMAYYVSTSSWPANIAALQTAGFLPSSLGNNPYANPYFINSDSSTGNFSVCTAVTSNNSDNAMTLAQTLAGMLPLGFVTDTDDPSSSCSPNMTPTTSCSQTSCTIVTIVNIPGQNLNNARSVNFAGIYKNGACVPVPQCPGGTGSNSMKASIMVVPVSVSGVYSNNSTVLPISSFTARATPSAMTPNTCADMAAGPQSCNLSAPGPYWRVCLQVITEKGEVTSVTNPQWGAMTSLMALTRCVPNNEPSGSDFSVYTND